MSTLDLAAAVLFALALLHTLCARTFERLAARQPRHAGLLHLLSEVEVVSGFWAFVLLVVMALLAGGDRAIAYAESRSYTEPLFVFAIMVVAASRPVLWALQRAVRALAGWVPGARATAEVWIGLALLPLLGSAVTEPGAMTLAALVLAPRVFLAPLPTWLKYGALGVLFVNVSIGGTLSDFAAPPVLMVAARWGWDSTFMLLNFGWKATLAVFVNASVLTLLIHRQARLHPPVPAEASAAAAAVDEGAAVPLVVTLVHLAFGAAIVAFAHHPVVFLGLFVFFIGYTRAYASHQSPLLLKEALLVGFFLAGLVVLGGLQQWWLQPLVAGLRPTALFFGALALTAVTDNAALTYLGSLVPGLPAQSQYLLVAGAVAGGGLTVIANAPNPAGAALLRDGFPDRAIGVGGLLLGAAAPTAVAAAALWLL